MKVFDIPWGEVLRNLSAWHALEPRVRRGALSNLREGVTPLLRDALPALIQGGIVEMKPAGPRPTDRWHVTLKVLRGMSRAPVWRAPDRSALQRYLEEHFSGEECADLCGTSTYRTRTALSRRAASAEWLSSFLSAAEEKRIPAWELERRGWGNLPARLTGPGLQTHLTALLRALLDRGGPVPMAELSGLVPELEGEPLEGALVAGLRYLLLFAGLDDEYLPRVGEWPPAVERILAPPPSPPAPCAVAEQFHVALLMEDMAVLLAAAAAEPVRLRMNDGAIFARSAQALAPRLLVPPAWANGLLPHDPAKRLELASSALRACRLAKQQEAPDPTLAATRAGEKWLAADEATRLKALLDRLRAGAQTGDGWGTPAWQLVPGYCGSDYREPMRAAFQSLEVGQFVPLRAFLAHRGVTDNPLLDKEFRRKARYTGLDYDASTPEQAEQRWRELLAGFLTERLVPLGGAGIGRAADAEICFALEPPGAYLLGATDRFDYGRPERAPLVVQPNFEIVFMAPAPKLEARFARFAERVGHGVGVLFRLTRESIQEAAGSGQKVDEMIAVLEDASAQPLPANVTRQLRDWAGQVRRVRLHRAVLIRCPDEATAVQVRAKLGTAVREVTPTLLEVDAPDGRQMTALAKQLRKVGVFVGE